MMKKLTVLFLLVSLVLVWSCGGGSDDKKAPKATAEKPKVTAEKKTKKYSLKTQEGMMKKLGEFGITIPQELAFVEIARKSSSYSAKFEKDGADEAVKASLDKWYAGLVSQLTSDGWSIRKMLENQKMFGLVSNENIFMKPKGGGSTLSNTLDITTVYDSKKKKYTLYVRPGEI